MKITILRGDVHLVQLRTRMPFKYGIATMTHMPQAFVRLAVDVDGKRVEGISSDLLPPKWFTKDPAKAVDLEIDEMLHVIRHAGQFAVGLSGASAFDVWGQLHQTQSTWGEREGLPPLLYHFGTSLAERALIEAVCRAHGKPFATMLRGNGLGIELGATHPALKGIAPGELLPAKPLGEIIARHTVGLADPLTDSDIAPGERLNDGLPQSLEACIRAYQLRHFKLKVNGQLEGDVARLHRIAEILEAHAPRDYAFTIDGNEQFKAIGAFQAFWEAVRQSPKLAGFLKHMLFIEQPLHRSVALDDSVGKEFKVWKDRPPIIIDESDATLESVPTALRLGYVGTSHKNCKGVFKGVASRCLLLQRQRQSPKEPAIMSGEDLCNLGPIALLQDLAVMAALGISSVERNGHHYVAGLSLFSDSVQQQVLAAHGDLYHRSAAGWPTVNIKDGRINVNSLNAQPLGVGFALDVAQFTQVAEWH
ncbi:MAG: hypothetical protein AB1705_24135 [Verrucomicrobiota bacterium]